VPFSGAVLDACGVCLPPGDASFNASCAGCDGVPNSGAVFDACCACGGNATWASACYQALLAVPAGAASGPFDPNNANVTHGAFFSALGRARYDECGECADWGYAGAECAGCDGVPMSGALADPCGVCGGGCACDAGAVSANGACDAGGFGAAPAGAPPCDLVQLSGPGSGGTPIYPATPQNKPGLPAWVDAVTSVCVRQGDTEPPPPPPAEWLVLLYGMEFGPFTLPQLRSGTVGIYDTVKGAWRRAMCSLHVLRCVHPSLR
jgi:hypothetical protein